MARYIGPVSRRLYSRSFSRAFSRTGANRIFHGCPHEQQLPLRICSSNLRDSRIPAVARSRELSLNYPPDSSPSSRSSDRVLPYDTRRDSDRGSLTQLGLIRKLSVSYPLPPIYLELLPLYEQTSRVTESAPPTSYSPPNALILRR